MTFKFYKQLSLITPWSHKNIININLGEYPCGKVVPVPHCARPRAFLRDEFASHDITNAPNTETTTPALPTGQIGHRTLFIAFLPLTVGILLFPELFVCLSHHLGIILALCRSLYPYVPVPKGKSCRGY